jgi:hypothetical protein
LTLFALLQNQSHGTVDLSRVRNSGRDHFLTSAGSLARVLCIIVFVFQVGRIAVVATATARNTSDRCQIRPDNAAVVLVVIRINETAAEEATNRPGGWTFIFIIRVHKARAEAR